MPFSIIYLICFSFFPETPEYLIRHNKLIEGENSLRFYRGLNKTERLPESVSNELKDMKANLLSPSLQDKIHLKDFSKICIFFKY